MQGNIRKRQPKTPHYLLRCALVPDRHPIPGWFEAVKKPSCASEESFFVFLFSATRHSALPHTPPSTTVIPNEVGRRFFFHHRSCDDVGPRSEESSPFLFGPCLARSLPRPLRPPSRIARSRSTSRLPGTNLLDEWIDDLPLIAEVQRWKTEIGNSKIHT